MRQAIRTLLTKLGERHSVALLFAVNGVLVVGGTAWAYFTLRNATTPLILHFSNAAGIDRIGTPEDLLRMGGLGLAIVAANALIALALAARDKFLAWLIALATLFLAILLFILFSVIISVN